MDEERIRNSEKHSISAQSRSEEMSKRVNDPVKKNGSQFLGIEGNLKTVASNEHTI